MILKNINLNSNFDRKKTSNKRGFTIVELIVTISIISILAAITIVSYRGITLRANETALISNLTNAKKQFALYYTEHSVYPTGLDANCPINAKVTPADTNYCLKSNDGTSYTLNSGLNGMSYSLKATKNSLLYSVSNTSSPSPTVDVGAGTDWKVVGSQTWAKANLNVGNMLTSATDQTNNSIIEKYCYNDSESNCTTYGALYLWNEAMQYSKIEGTRGICPAGSHIPSDNDWKILEMQLGMSQSQADETSYRGTDQGMQLKSGGTSGLSLPLAGIVNINGSFANLSSVGYFWSSSEYGASAWQRYLNLNYNTVLRGVDDKNLGFSIRCLGN